MASMCELFFESFSLNELGHNVEVSVGLNHILKLKNVGVRNHFEGFDFIVKESTSGLITES